MKTPPTENPTKNTISIRILNKIHVRDDSVENVELINVNGSNFIFHAIITKFYSGPFQFDIWENGHGYSN